MKKCNKVVLYSYYAEIILLNCKGEEVSRAKIDLDMVDVILECGSWHLHSKGYVRVRKGKTHVRLHRFIMNPSNTLQVDRINHDKLDNRRDNLRICTNSQNQMNKECKGYYYDKNGNKWVSHITLNKKTVTIGRFNTELEAIQFRKDAEVEYFDEFRLRV